MATPPKRQSIAMVHTVASLIPVFDALARQHLLWIITL